MTEIKVEIVDDDTTDENSNAFKEREYDKEFPKTLEEFGYKFDESGSLKNIETGEAFNFNVKPNDNVYNQRHYEALGEVITDYVYDYMDKFGLKKITIPIDAQADEPVTHVYHSVDALDKDCLVILIHGSGVVRAGQWARRLLINDNFKSGSQIPFIKRAIGLGFGVLVLNTNDNSRERNGVVHKIRGSETAEKHANYVWRKIVATKSTAKHIAIIAHSYGGIVTVNMYKSFPEVFQDRVFAIAFTDSPHSLVAQNVSLPNIKWFRKVARNWVSSHEPLDTPLVLNNQYEVQCFSAGTQRHDMTSWMAFSSIYSYIDQRLKKRIFPFSFSSGQSE